ncbi:MarR family winged helix-turn-helix transcriptional regulator [Amycolatopsis sp. YIM 10]|uniref:MarR family winged helix-turn-helix transcriptional regulator n=1 Tax=Amycolatopsis sp. YIM 10 TaxID=2653857 RepID=UPI00129011D3|nr:MarR family transcriptional regulator [Amycolatopsis sp. YIM 10]QFU86632.1 transcriptional repressor MprA [Amycolatopsis sp. YIM 10]
MNRIRSHPDPEELLHVLTEVVEQVEVIWERSRSTSPAPLSVSQLRAMFVLETAEYLNVRDLATALNSSPPSVSRLCDRLQAVGFLDRSSSSVSRREVELRLSDRGRQYLVELRERRTAHLRDVIGALPATTRSQLAGGLARLRDAAVKHNRPPGAQHETDTRSA